MHSTWAFIYSMFCYRNKQCGGSYTIKTKDLVIFFLMNIQLGKVLYQLEPDTITCFSVNITKHNWSSDLVYLSISLEESSHPKNTKQSQGCKRCKWIRQSVAFGSPTASANSGMVNKQRTATQMHSEKISQPHKCTQRRSHCCNAYPATTYLSALEGKL